MGKHNFGYFIKEGATNLFKHGFMSFAAIGITVACLLIMGTFTLVAVNANEMLKAHQKDSDITEDELKKGLERVQKETDAGIAKIDELASKKEKEVLEL